MVRDPMNTPVHAVRHMRHGLPSAYTRRKLTERREVYATQKKSGRVVLEVCRSPPLERGPSVPVPQDLLSSCDRGSIHCKTTRVLMLQEELVQLSLYVAL